jgi:hypothetical protein
VRNGDGVRGPREMEREKVGEVCFKSWRNQDMERK